ncbi:MAG TPA: response regulator transcription factor [Rhodanobacteraceae bacterium]|nr:response regulator transcription factor [Rhodanobacteraceae bacterium]
MACNFQTRGTGDETAQLTRRSGAVVYVLDGDAARREHLVDYLARDGFTTAGFADAPGFHRACAARRCDLAVIDLDHDTERALALAERLRGVRETGIVALSASARIDARLRSFECGADAHLSKPVDLRELGAQLRAIHRRIAGVAAPSAIEASARSGWTLREDGWIVEDPTGHAMTLTTAERAFVLCLVAMRGQPVSRDELIASLGGNPSYADPHRIDVLVNRLRGKAARMNVALPLHAVRSKGYVLAIETAHARVPTRHAPPAHDGADGVLRPLFPRSANAALLRKRVPA